MHRAAALCTKRLDPALWLAAVLCSVAAPGVAASGSVPSGAVDPRPNLVLIVADDLGWSDLGHRGSPARTPHLDRLFREGADLRRFYVSPYCTPTRAALLTGRRASHYGLGEEALKGWSQRGLPAEAVTVAERLQAQGYQTALVGKWHLGHAHAAYHPNRQGFEHFYGHLIGARYYEHSYHGGLDFQRNGESLAVQGYATDLLGAEAARVIRARDPARPLFLTLAFYAPHTPLQAPPELLAHYAQLARPEARVYAAMIEALDRAVGGVLGVLEQEGIAARTLVLFLSDNGAPRGGPGNNAPLRGAKGQLFEGGIRVPAALRWPGVVEPGRVLERPATDLDVTPTLLSAAAPGAPLDPALEGESLVPYLTRVPREGHPARRAPLFFSARAPGARLRAVIAFPWKLIRVESSGGRVRRLHLFDVLHDPAERRDLRRYRPRLRAALGERLAAFEAERGEAAPTASRRPRDWKAPSEWSTLAGPR